MVYARKYNYFFGEYYVVLEFSGIIVFNGPINLHGTKVYQLFLLHKLTLVVYKEERRRSPPSINFVKILKIVSSFTIFGS